MSDILEWLQRYPSENREAHRQRLIKEFLRLGLIPAPDLVVLFASVDKGPEFLANYSELNADKHRQWMLAWRAMALFLVFLVGLVTYEVVATFQNGHYMLSSIVVSNLFFRSWWRERLHAFFPRISSVK